MDPIEYRNGSEDITPRKIPGLKKFTNIMLKRGIIGDLTFWNWILEGMNGTVQRTEGSIVLLDEAKQRGDALELQARLADQMHRPRA